MQTTSHILMIRPVQFGYNPQTAVNNAFQQASADQQAVAQAAQLEFDAMVSTLRHAGVDVTVVQDTPEPHTPDSIFPNNWVSFHSDGSIVLYPMYAVNRRNERKPQVLESVAKQFNVGKQIDFSHYESGGVFLEGTGSMVLDRDNKIAYACISPRTDVVLLQKWCSTMGYSPVTFKAVDESGNDIYHTNVMMCVADRYVVICLECITNLQEQQEVVKIIEASGKIVIDITFDQVNHFAGNMLQVENNNGEKLLVMSSQAYQSLTEGQVALLESFNRIIHSNINTIETNGGGSARCMMAEIHLPLRL